MAGKCALHLAGMPRLKHPISLADLSAAGVRLRPYEAVTLVRELVLQAARGEVAGVPSAHVIRLSGARHRVGRRPGRARAEGRRCAPRSCSTRCCRLQMPGNQFRVPGGLKLVVARALGTLDLPPFPSLEAFAEALARFSATDPAATVTNLVVSWSEFVASARVPRGAAEADADGRAQVEPFVRRGRWTFAGHLPRIPDRFRHPPRAPCHRLAAVRTSPPAAGFRSACSGSSSGAISPTGRAASTGGPSSFATPGARGLDEQLVLSTIGPLLDEPIGRQPLPRPDESPRPMCRRRSHPRSPRLRSVEPSSRPSWRTGSPAARPAARWRGHGPVANAAVRRWSLAALAIPALLSSVSARVVGRLVDARVTERRGGEQNAAAARSPANPSPVCRQAAERRAVSVADRNATVNRQQRRRASRRRGTRRRATEARHWPTPVPETAAGASSIGWRPIERRFSPSFASVGTAMFYHPDE